MVGLQVARNAGREIMVGSADETVLLCFPEVVTKFPIQMAFSLRGFYEYELYACAVGIGGGGYFFPVDGALVVAHINTVNTVVGREFGLAEAGAPTMAVRRKDKVVEE